MSKQTIIKKIKTLFVVSLLVIAVAGPLPAGRAEMGDEELIVEIFPGADVYAVAARHSLEVLSYINDDGHHIYLLRNLSSMTLADVIEDLNRDGDVNQVELNLISTVAEIDGLGQRAVMWLDGGCGDGVADQQALNRIRAPEAQQISTGAGVIVAVIDTGLGFGTGFNTVSGYDFVERDEAPWDTTGGSASGHGTMVASLVLAVAPDAQIMPIRAFDENGFTGAFQLAQAIEYARVHGASVINMSFSFADEVLMLKNAIDRAHNEGITLVAAAGNDGSGLGRFPARRSAIIAVGAVDDNDIRADFSNWGLAKLAAPGVGLETNGLAGSCSIVDGTSFAAALVSGEAALLVAAGHSDVENDIKTHTVNIQNVPGSGSLKHRIDCYAALTQTDPN